MLRVFFLSSWLASLVVSHSLETPRADDSLGSWNLRDEQDSSEWERLVLPWAKRDARVLGNARSISWEKNTITYNITVDQPDCFQVKTTTKLGDYTFKNGTTGINVTAGELAKDFLALKSTSDDWDAAITDQLLLNANLALKELVALFPDQNSHIELRHLLSIPEDIQGSIWAKAKWVLYLTPSVGGGALIGFFIALGLNQYNQSAATKNEVQTALVVAASAFVQAMIQKMQLRNEPEFFTRADKKAIAWAILWVRRIAGALKHLACCSLTEAGAAWRGEHLNQPELAQGHLAAAMPGDPPLPVIDAQAADLRAWTAQAFVPGIHNSGEYGTDENC